MNWVAYSFMQMRHVSMLGTLGGGGGGRAIRGYCTRHAVVSAATAFSSPPFWIKELGAWNDIAWGTGRGLVTRRSADKHTSLGGRIGITIRASIIPSDGRGGDHVGFHIGTQHTHKLSLEIEHHKTYTSD